MKLFSLIILLTSINAFSLEGDKERLLKMESIKDKSFEELVEDKDTYLTHESILEFGDSETNLTSDAFYTAFDNWRISLGYGFSADYEDLNKVQAVDFTYLQRIHSYKGLWWSWQAKSLQAKFNAISDEHGGSSTLATAENNFTRFDSTQTMTALGIGMAYRFKALGNIFNTDKVFEVVHSHLNYIISKDSLTAQQYSGYGVTSEYGLHYRSGQNFFYGFKLVHNLALLERAPEDEETRQDRSLVFGWLNFGLEFGYYYN